MISKSIGSAKPLANDLSAMSGIILGRKQYRGSDVFVL